MKPLLQFLFLFALAGKGQSQVDSIRAVNSKYLDSVGNRVRVYYCNSSLSYPSKYNRAKIQKDRSVISFLNKVYRDTLTVKGLNYLILSLKRVQLNREDSFNGLVSFSKIIISGNYIRIELNISYIDDTVIRKHFYLNTLTAGVCDASNINTRVLDYSLLRKVVSPEAEFSIGLWGNRYIFNESYSFDGLNVLSGKYLAYRFNIPDDLNKDLINQAFYNQYNNDSSCCYSYQTPDRYFVTFIKNGQLDVIENLLYSPNYFYSINAMEALIYLQSIGKVNIDSKMNERIKFLKESKYKITVRKTSDFYSTVDGYSSIGVTDAMIIQKYKSIK